MRRIAMLLSLVILLSACQYASAEDMTFEKAIKAWAFMEGDWNLKRPDQIADEISVKMAPNKACYILSGQKGHVVLTFDGSAKKMLAFGSHQGGATTYGHWMPAGDGVVEGTFTNVTAEGEKTEHSAKFEVIDKDHFKYTIDGDAVYTFERR